MFLSKKDLFVEKTTYTVYSLAELLGEKYIGKNFRVFFFMEGENLIFVIGKQSRVIGSLLEDPLRMRKLISWDDFKKEIRIDQCIREDFFRYRFTDDNNNNKILKAIMLTSPGGALRLTDQDKSELRGACQMWLKLFQVQCDLAAMKKSNNILIPLMY